MGKKTACTKSLGLWIACRAKGHWPNPRSFQMFFLSLGIRWQEKRDPTDLKKIGTWVLREGKNYLG